MNFRKMLCAMCAICVLISLCACKRVPNQEIHQGELSENEDEVSFISVMLGDNYLEECDENGINTRVSWTKLALLEEEQSSFPSLKKTLDKLNSTAATEAKALMYELRSAAKELGDTEYAPPYLEGESTVFVQRADSELLSYLEENYVYSGGVHPNTYYTAYNFNPKTGEKLHLSDVLKSLRGLPDILEKQISEKYDYVEFADDALWTIFSEYSQNDYQWTMDYQGITFWFSPYELASYAVGTLSTKIYFDEWPTLFKKQYIKAPSENLGIMLPKNHIVDFDLIPDDGKRDFIEITTPMEQYGSYSMLSVTVNGASVTDEINYAYDFDVYLAQTGGKNYIYTDSVSDSDYHMLCTWDINGEEPEQIHELYGAAMKSEFVEEGVESGTAYREILNNPDSFRLEKRFDILGTRRGWATFKATEATGIPEMTDTVYTFKEGQNVTLKIPLEAEILPDMGKEELGDGMLLMPYQTDGRTFVDLKTEDSWIVRFRIDVSDRTVKVNGIPETECFNDLLYAG